MQSEKQLNVVETQVVVPEFKYYDESLNHDEKIIALKGVLESDWFKMALMELEENIEEFKDNHLPNKSESEICDLFTSLGHEYCDYARDRLLNNYIFTRVIGKGAEAYEHCVLALEQYVSRRKSQYIFLGFNKKLDKYVNSEFLKLYIGGHGLLDSLDIDSQEYFSILDSVLHGS